MNLTTVSPPAFEPVTLAQVYSMLRVEPSIDSGESPAVLTHPLDADYTRNIEAARLEVEDLTGRSLVKQTLRLSVAGFPAASYDAARALDKFAIRRIDLLRPPVISVSAVEYYDADNVLQTVSPSSYYVTDSVVPELRFVSSFSAPTVYVRPDAVRVTYVAGYTPDPDSPATQEGYAANVPKPLVEAVLIGVQLLQTSLSPRDEEMLRRAIDSLVSKYVVKVLL